jgi:hypothetical protein
LNVKLAVHIVTTGTYSDHWALKDKTVNIHHFVTQPTPLCDTE